MPKKQTPLIRKTDKTNSIQQTSMSEFVFMSRYSVLPPPKELAEYEKLTPGITDRLMTLYEKQQNHRIEVETTAINTGSKIAVRGQIFAFILGFVVILGGLGLLFKGRNIAGYSLLIGTTATLTGSFIYGKTQNKREREYQAKQNPIIT